MKVFIGADHRGFEMKGHLVTWLHEQGHEVVDMGAPAYDEADDYPDYGVAVAREVAKDTTNHRGIVLCGSGVGMAVVADKVKGVRAALIHDPQLAGAARNDDDITVLALGTDFIDLARAEEVIAAWLATPFSGEARHQRRLDKITHYEHEHSCPCHAD